MKNLSITAIMGVLLFIGLASMVSQDPPYNAKQCQSDCAALVGAGFFSSHGRCMSACATCTNPSQGESRAVCFCKLIDAEIGLENLDVNFGQCVTIVKGDN